MKREYALFMMMFVLFVFSAKGQTHLDCDGRSDGFQIELKRMSDSEAIVVNLVVDNNYTAGWDGPMIDGQDINSHYPFRFTGYIAGINAYLKRDTRPYEGYYVDFPFYMRLDKTGEHQIRLIMLTTIVNRAAVVHRLIDKKNPDLFIDLLNEGPYSFIAGDEDMGHSYDRFVLRIYAGSLFKPNAEDDQWGNEANWYGGVPGKGQENRLDNCAIIPDGAKVVIPKGFNYSVGSLLNSGELVIEEGACLDIEYEARLASVDDLY